jgi:hypothetical protein
MKKLIQLLVFAALVTTLALPALAQGTTTNAASTAGAQDETQAKAELYKKFTDNRTANPPAAYEAAKEYLSKYAAKDGPDDQYIKYLNKWVSSYDKVAKRQALIEAFNNKNYTTVFASAKDVIADYPDDVDVLYLLVKAGYLSAATGSDANNADAAMYAKKLIPFVQSGKNPDPGKSKDEVLGSLNYAIGLFLQKTQPAEAATYFINAAQFEGTSKKDPQTYIFIADFYEKGDYATLAKQYTDTCKTPEQVSSQSCVDLKAKVDNVVDHIIDALARAIAYSNTAPNAAQLGAARTAWTEAITNYYKYRNNGADTGLKELLASITSRPLPKPGEAVTPSLFPASTTPATGSTTPGAASTTTTAPKTTTAPANTKAGTTTTTSQPTGKTTSSKTTPKRAH